MHLQRACPGPLWCRYIEAFQSGFDEGLGEVQLSFMQSDGGLSPVSSFSGHKAILSGPAGGVSCCLAAKSPRPHTRCSSLASLPFLSCYKLYMAR